MPSKTITLTVTTVDGSVHGTHSHVYKSFSHLLLEVLPHWRDEVTTKTGTSFVRLYKTIFALVEKITTAFDAEWKKTETK